MSIRKNKLKRALQVGRALIENKLGRGQRRLGRVAKVILSVPPLTAIEARRSQKWISAGAR